ncbi:MAG: hypothetical protein UHD64_02950 [Bacteroidales bacterium]|nr:hypothetical protein [Bacteroidales bacterium]
MAETKNQTVEQTKTELLKFTENLDSMKQYAAAVDNILQLVDLTSSATKTWTVFSKDSLRTYLQNPYSANSQTNLRNLAKFLYTLSFPLRRIINYFASLPDFSMYKVNLDFSLVEDNDEESLLQDYEDACRFIRKMNLEINMFKMLLIAWREGIVYFQPYQDDDGTMLLMPLDSQYCKISSVGYNNLLHVAYDFSYFNGSNSFYLEIWDPEYKTKYNAYQRDNTLRWQELETARAFKIDISDIDLIIPTFASLFEGLIDLIDLQSLIAVKDSLDIYKLLVMKIPLLNSKNPDDLALSLTLAQKFYAKALGILPEEIGLVLSPGMDIESVSFDKNATSDTNAIADSYQNLMEQTGISQIFDSSRLTGASSVKMSMLADAMMATKGIMKQVEAFVNERIQMEYSNSVAYIKFIDVTTYTKDDRIAQVKDAASLGLPVKQEYMTLLGYDPLEAIASDWLETKLEMSVNRFIHPLVSSHTQSGSSDTGGAPQKDNGELTDEGEETKEQEKNIE